MRKQTMRSKHEIRMKHRAKRDLMTPEAVVEQSAAIQARLLDHPAVREARSWFVYASFRCEVGTHELIRLLLERNCHVSIPLVVGEQMIAREISSLEALRAGPLGILEPTPGEDYPARIDACVCPGLAFTERGDRLGRGRGYYDRFLAVHQPALIVGLAFDWQIVPELPSEAYDQRMDLVVTDERAISIRHGLT